MKSESITLAFSADGDPALLPRARIWGLNSNFPGGAEGWRGRRPALSGTALRVTQRVPFPSSLSEHWVDCGPLLFCTRISVNNCGMERLGRGSSWVVVGRGAGGSWEQEVSLTQECSAPCQTQGRQHKSGSQAERFQSLRPGGKFDITSVGRGGTWESEEVAGQGGETGVMETTDLGAEECRRGR